MVVGAFPVAKLGALLLKQVSKPLANLVKTRAKNSPFFRNYICMPPAQFYHWAEVKMKMWSMNLGKPVNIPKLNETLAIDLGAELLGEGIIFVIAAGILINEFIRSVRKENAKEEERVAEKIQIQNDLRDLYYSTAKQDAQIRELVRILNLTMPEVKYLPKDKTNSLIPLYHHDEHKEEEETSMFTTFSGWVWNAIELIVPTAEETETTPSKISVTSSSGPAPSPIKLEIVPSAPTIKASQPSPSNNQVQDIKNNDKRNETKAEDKELKVLDQIR